MCGIIGYIKGAASTTATTKLADAFFQGLYVTALRGTDAFGYMFNVQGKFIRVGEYEQSTVQHHKQASHAVFNGGSKESSAAKSLIRNSPWAVGHCRAATQGAKDLDRNAHPFHHGDVTMVHNGTLRGSYFHLNDRYVEVDSHAICMALATRPLNDVLDELNGAYALVWFDNRDRCLHFVRNEERPMEFVTCPSTGDMFFASEGWMAWGPMHRNGLRDLETTVLPVNTHKRYNIDTKTWAEDEVYVPAKKYPMPTYIAPVTTWGGGGTKETKKVSGNVFDGRTGTVVTPFNRFPETLSHFILNEKELGMPIFQHHSSVKFLRDEQDDMLTTVYMGINSTRGDEYNNAVLALKKMSVLVAINRFSRLDPQSEFCSFEGDIISHTPGEMRSMFPISCRSSLIDWVGDVNGIVRLEVAQNAVHEKHLLIATFALSAGNRPVLRMDGGLTYLNVGLALATNICDELHPEAEEGTMMNYNDLLGQLGE